MRSKLFPAMLACWVLSGACWAQEKNAMPAKAGEEIARLAAEVDAAKSVIKSPWVSEWMSTVAKLPPVEPKTVTYNERDLVVDEQLFYSSRYGSPLAYARALDLAVAAGFQGDVPSKIFDFGYGSIGHLRMLALTGHRCVGVDVAPLLKVLYADASGPLGKGSVELLDGRFPKEQELVAKTGKDFDLVISKNVLKRGYIHPTRDVSDKRMLIELGVDDDTFLDSVAEMLRPNGLFVIYNFCPAKSPADKPYVPWAEGESPFSREAFEKAGFDVLQFDVNDDREARRLAHALQWDASGGMDLEKDLFAWYTIARKRTTKNP
jgi:hypothetical protein